MSNPVIKKYAERNTPAAFVETPITYHDIITKTGIGFAVLLVAAFIGWQLPNNAILITFTLVAFGIGIWAAVKREPSPPLILLYFVLQGYCMGAVSMVYESQYTGVVLQAILATLCVFGVTLFSYMNGWIRTSPKVTKFVLIATAGYVIFAFVSFLLSAFLGFSPRDAEIGGIPLGLPISIFAVLLATYNLLIDFDYASEAVESGMPVKESWRISFALILTLIWIYLEILRILGYIRDLSD